MATAQRLRRPGLRLPVKVICCGNATAGGTGKTIVALAIADILLAAGHRPAFISRGYGGKLRGPLQIDRHQHSAHDVGDEPLLLAAKAPCFIGRDRAAAARLAISHSSRFTHLILDDGLQNPALIKDISLLLIDGGVGFGNGHMIPAGPLREPVAAAVARVQAAMIIGADQTHARAQLPPGLPVLQASLHPNMADLRNTRVVGFAGIGRPEKFRASLIEAGAELVDFAGFADHHFYTDADITQLRATAIRLNARLFTTRKDFVRLPPAWRTGIDTMDIALLMDPAESLQTLLCCTAT